MRECCKQSQAEVVCNSRNKFHQSLGPPFIQDPYNSPNLSQYKCFDLVSALLERLTGGKTHDEVAAVIVESGLETVYLMEGRFGRGNLARSATLLGPKLLLPMGCVKLGEKIAFTCLLWVNKPQINYPISRNP